MERNRFVPSPYLGQLKVFTFIISSSMFPSRGRAVPPPSRDWLIKSQQSFAVTQTRNKSTHEPHAACGCQMILTAVFFLQRRADAWLANAL